MREKDLVRRFGITFVALLTSLVVAMSLVLKPGGYKDEILLEGRISDHRQTYLGYCIHLFIRRKVSSYVSWN